MRGLNVEFGPGLQAEGATPSRQTLVPGGGWRAGALTEGGGEEEGARGSPQTDPAHTWPTLIFTTTRAFGSSFTHLSTQQLLSIHTLLITQFH